MTASKVFAWSLFLCFACNGTNGQNGVGTLFRVIPEAPGANCPNGGSVIQVGQDTNFNGQLENEEVTATTFVCNGEDGEDGDDGTNGQNGGEEPFGAMLQGSFTIQNEFDVARFQAVEEVGGSLSIAAVGLSSVLLPNLTTVHGSVVISVPANLPELKFIGASLAIFAATTDVPKLLSIGAENPDGIDVNALTLFASANGASISANSLTLIEGNVNIFGFSQANANTTFTFSNSLQTITGGLSVVGVGGTSLLSFPGIQSLDSLAISSNADLTALNFPSLTNVTTQFAIQSNPLLPTCQAQNLRDQLDIPPTTIIISGNNDAGTCP